ncbi:MAG: hypothetical protein CMF50_09495, partial [Legionellales bacterium]|nr:hypothetical protein [Legionellales bacterium]
SFTYTITNDDGTTDSATVTVTVTGVEDPLGANNDTATTDEDTLVSIPVLANDVDLDDGFSITGVTAPAAGTVSINGANIDFDPNGDFDSLDAGDTAIQNFTYTITNDDGTTSSATVSVTVNGLGSPNVAPTLADIDVLKALPQTTSPAFRYEASDLDADGFTSDNPAPGTSIFSWTDKSSASNNAGSTGTRPVLSVTDNQSYVDFTTPGTARLNPTNASEINTSSYTEKTISMTFRTGTDLSGTQVLYEQGAGVRGYTFIMEGGELYAMAFNNTNEWGPATADRYKPISLGFLATETVYTAVMVHDSFEVVGPDTGTFRAYLNGVEAATFQTDVPFQRAHSGGAGIGDVNGSIRHPVTFGTVNAGNSSNFLGEISHVTSWNDVFTPLELSANAVANFGGSMQLTTTLLNAQDIDNSPSELTYTVSGEVNGQLELVDSAGVAISSFTQADVNAGKVVFVHDGSAATTASFDFTLGDPTVTPFSDTITMYVTTPVTGGNGSQTLIGTENSDVITGGNGSDTLYGEIGADLLDGENGKDSLFGGEDDDILIFDSQDNIADGGSGTNDILRIDDNNENVDITSILNQTNGLDITNIERISLIGDNQTLELTSDGSDNDISEITDSNNTLYVDGNNTTTVILNLTGGSWSAGTAAGDYTSYTNGTSTLLIDNDISTVTIL